MDQIKQFQTAIKKVLQEYLRRFSTAKDKAIETLLSTDDQHGVYMVIKNGWRGKDRIQNILIFIRVVNEKIWVEEDWTDFDVVGRLMEAGIPQDKIVLAFHHPDMRPLTEFATA
jgi:undecaprenyl pyrophosphate synthase